MEVTALFDRPRLRFCLRMTIAAVLAFALAQFLAVPLHGLWVVLTAVVVTQMSVGGSLRATAEYVIGTLGGAIYAGAVAVLVPHTTMLATAGVLALAIAPLAYAAAVNPSFRVAPFTAVIVLLVSIQLGDGPIESAFYRLLEVGLGGAVAVAVSLLVFPERAHGLGLGAAARVLEQLARVLPKLLAGFTRNVDVLENLRIQDETGQAVAEFQAIAAEAKRERLVNLAAEPDPTVLARTLLRLRHDLVIIGGAGVAPLPPSLAERLGPSLARIGASASDFLLASARALAWRRSPPPLDPVKAALAAYEAEIISIRNEGLTNPLPSSDVEHIFALCFALQQLQRNFSDLARHVQESARRPGLTSANPPASPPNDPKTRFSGLWFRSSAEKEQAHVYRGFHSLLRTRQRLSGGI
jgi:uncharacterized membrane protein YccC